MVDELENNEFEADPEEPPSLADEEPPSLTEVASLQRQDNAHVLSSRNDWRWQMKHRIHTVQDLRHYLPEVCQATVSEAISRFPMAITPYYASLIRSADHTDPIFMMSVPQIQELADSPYVTDDPLEEGEDTPVPGLVHRYPDRALLVVTSTCAMYCRHCTRKRAVGSVERCITQSGLEQVSAYLNTHPEIHDVIISGGDPLTMSTAQLEKVIKAVKSAPNVDIIRIGTRTPVTMPMRITDELVQMLAKYQPIWINTHFNHPNEITAESKAACERLADAGFPLGNQSVLLRGVNDSPHIIERLCRELLKIRVRPYYLYQCDLVRGVEHFRTPITRGLEIMEYLRGRLSGLGIPTFIVDLPHGGGKIPVLPNYVMAMSPTQTVLRNGEGMFVSYPEPSQSTVEPIAAQETTAPSVWDLLSGHATAIYPASSSRLQRRKQHRAPVQENI